MIKLWLTIGQDQEANVVVRNQAKSKSLIWETASQAALRNHAKVRMHDAGDAVKNGPWVKIKMVQDQVLATSQVWISTAKECSA